MNPALNPQQAAVVRHRRGPLLVLAGAGTGKTRVLAARAAALIREEGVPPQRLLLLTFTRRAAEEMRRRVAEMAALDPRDLPWCGTFHATAARLLHLFADSIGLPRRFTILDEHDAQALIRSIVVHQTPDKEERKKLPSKATLARIHSYTRNRRCSLEETLALLAPKYEDQADAIAAVFEAYRRRKQESRALDYDDLLETWLQLLDSDRGAACAALFEHIMVDEYQDTNPLQAAILEKLCREHRNIMVVGDDAQAIYSFRGATVENIRAFEPRFPGAARLTLEQNYRSTQPILNLANQLIRQAEQAFHKELFTQTRPGGERPLFWCCTDAREEARIITSAILHSRDADGIPLSEQAVLFRSSHHSLQLEVALRRKHIPYRKFGGLRFAETAHVKDLLAFLRCRENRNDEAAWLRALALLPGIGETTAAKIFRHIRAAAEPPPAALDAYPWPRRSQQAGRKFTELMHALFDPDPPKPLPEEIDAIRAFYDPILAELFDMPETRKTDLDELRKAAADYPDRRSFLEDILVGDDSVLAESPGEPEPYLTLSTIHSAKGREWDAVYIMALYEGGLPSGAALQSPETIEEERRMLYVAVTRARRRLVLTAPVFAAGARSSYNPFAEPGGSQLRYSRFLTPEVLACCGEPGKTARPASSAAGGEFPGRNPASGSDELIYDTEDI